ncbi:hypothetical protein BURMUCF2_A2188 [Burkholderia multivorans CF2]|nr:hypothetical protein BURMUCF2_A2188 [Burkholderia multivorans CF2]
MRGERAGRSVRALFDFPAAGLAERGDSPRDPSSAWRGATVRPTSSRDIVPADIPARAISTDPKR